MKKLYAATVLFSLWAAASPPALERYCLPCHRAVGLPLRQVFMNSLLLYGGRENMKAGLRYFLRHPSIGTSAMGEEYFRTHPLMKPLELPDAILDEALDQFWERYKVLGRLK